MDEKRPPGYQEYLCKRESEERKPSFKAKQWRERAERDLALIMEAAAAASTTFELHRRRLQDVEKTALSRIESQVLQKATELGLGTFETVSALSARVDGRGYEDRPGTAEQDLLSFWMEQTDLALMPGYDDKSREVERLYFGAMTIALRSILETALQELQGVAQSCRPKDIAWQDLKDDQDLLNSARRALEKIHGLSVEKNYWDQVKRLAPTRNRFAHGLGRIASSDGDIGTLRKLPGLKLRESVWDEKQFDIVVSQDYLGHCWTAIQQLLVALESELSKWDAPRGVA